MSGRLDDLIEGLRTAAPDRDLSQLEPAVWRRIGGAGGERFWGLGALPLRAGAVAMALVVGAAVGGATATAAGSEPAETSVFALHAQLAPSTLLGEGR